MTANSFPRDQHEEGFALTNFDFRFFDPTKRNPVDVSKLGFHIFPDLFESGGCFIRDLAEEEEKSKMKAEQRPEKKSWLGQRLKDLRPWQGGPG